MSNYFNELIESVKQNTAWDTARLGKFTGSRLGDLFVQPKTKEAKELGEWSKTAETYILSKVMEIVTGQAQDGASGAAIDHGNEWEETALLELQKAIGCPDEKTNLRPGFKLFNSYSGASPDAFMELNGTKVGVEMKCPFNPINHYHHSQIQSEADLKRINSDYYWQVQMNMLTYGLGAWIFASFDPRQPEHRRLHWAICYAVPEDMQIACDIMEKAKHYRDSILNQWMLNTNLK